MRIETAEQLEMAIRARFISPDIGLYYFPESVKEDVYVKPLVRISLPASLGRKKMIDYLNGLEISELMDVEVV